MNKRRLSLGAYIRGIFAISAICIFTGCTGIITGHEYSKTDLVVVYKVIKSGVSTFMTPEQIEEAKLNKIDLYVTDTYKLVAPSELEDQTSSPNTQNTQNTLKNN